MEVAILAQSCVSLKCADKKSMLIGTDSSGQQSENHCFITWIT